jgi:hypothetical protein
VHSSPDVYNDGRGENAGWLAGLLVIVAIFAVGATFWFMYHP